MRLSLAPGLALTLTALRLDAEEGPHRLVVFLVDGDGRPRIADAQILGGPGEPSAVPGLLDALAKEEDPLAKMAFQTALRDITGVAS